MTSTRLAVIDHGAGNLVSIGRALTEVGGSVTIATKPADLLGADGWVLPGVGATGAAMRRLAEAGFLEPLRERDQPILGICVGLQLLYERSEEDGGQCLGIERGTVTKLVEAPRLPHIGWNDVSHSDDPLFDGLDEGPTFYFVHSFAAEPDDRASVIATTTYGRPFTAAIRSGRRIGVQFHPERSGSNGLVVLANYVSQLAISPVDA